MATPDVRTLVQKADLALSELTSLGGVLQPKQAAKWMKIMIDASVLLPEVTVQPMSSPQEEIDQFGFLSTVLRRATDGQALSAMDRVKPTLSKVTLVTKELKAECRLTDSQLEDNIEGKTFGDTIANALMEAAGRDLENLVVNGDVASADILLVTLDGLLKQATSNIVDLTGSPATISRAHGEALMKTLPAQFQKNKRAMRFFTSWDAEIKQRTLLADRGTVMGDIMVSQDVPVLLMGVPMIGIPLFPTTLGAGTNETNILYCDPKESVRVGIQRSMRLESERNVREGATYFIVSLRVDVKFSHEPAVAKAIKVLAA